MRSLADLRLAWRARPGSYTPAVWGLILALDRLPWPWGEEIMAGCFAARAFVRRAHLRRALAWARAQCARGSAGPELETAAERSARQLALSLCAHHGRFVAR